MNDFRTHPLQPEIRAVTRNASVVAEAVLMVAEAQEIVRLIEAAVCRDEFGELRSLEAGARHHVENAVAAVSIFGRVAAALRFENVHILRIELRPDAREIAV